MARYTSSDKNIDAIIRIYQNKTTDYQEGHIIIATSHFLRNKNEEKISKIMAVAVNDPIEEDCEILNKSL